MKRYSRGLFTVLLTGLLIFLFSNIVSAKVDEQNRVEKEETRLVETKANLASVDRIKGDNRYLTAIEVSKTGWDSADTVVLARGDDYADALTSAPLAYKNGGPILLTPSDRLLDSTKAEMRRLGVRNVIIVGGEAAVSSKVEADIRQAGMDVTRFAGTNRYETAAIIADEFDAERGTIFLVNGSNFPDALSVAPYAAMDGIPILLTSSNKLPEVTKEKIAELDPWTWVVGGSSVIPDKVWFQIPTYDKYRISGEDRYATNVIMSELSGLNVLGVNHMFVATGMDYADALTGAVLAANHETGLLLVRPNKVPEVVSNYIQNSELTGLTIFGGNSAVSTKVGRDLEKLLQ